MIQSFTGKDAMDRYAARSLRLLAVPAVLLLVSSCAGTPALSGGDFKVLGRATAPVTVVEYTDLQCPYCGMFSRTTFPELKRLYIDKGKVRFESHDLPLPFHAQALPAAVAARCAGEQGKYWPYRELVAQHQDELTAAPYDRFAAELQLDAKAFADCRASGRMEPLIAADVREARRQGISATPSFVIRRSADPAPDGPTVTGAKPFEEFRTQIDALLKKKK